MTLDEFETYCASKPGSSACFPFNASVLVYKVCGKMFAFTNIDLFERLTLKADPKQSVHWRSHYPEVTPGYHMNKKHWNTLSLTGQLTNQQIIYWIDHAYEQVVAGLPLKEKKRLLTL